MLKERAIAIDNNTSEIPEYVYESLARSLLPIIQKYFELSLIHISKHL